MSLVDITTASSAPFALNLSKGVFRGTCFDKLSTNGKMGALPLAAERH
ncbi:hypothetical protein J2Y58_003147 [Sphingomonas sp. BE138]|nr:hypothetical protein [Sphingomonas sp. BE138]MDR6789772.1 hypothetical protein [Sphingomonas sp. BE138]